jgi:hypothetical protein
MPLTLRFIYEQHQDDDHGNNDDVITISRSHDDFFKVQYRDAQQGAQRIQEFSMNGDAVYRYVSRLLNLVAIDSAPFFLAQVSSPIMPSVLVRLNDLKKEENVQKILDVVSITLDNWPAPAYLDDEETVADEEEDEPVAGWYEDRNPSYSYVY